MNTNTNPNITVINPITLQSCLVQNNRFAGIRITADHIGAEGLSLWNTLISNLHSSAYSVYALCENSDLQAEDSSVDKSEVYNALRAILSALGEVKGHKLYANEELALLAIGYSGKRGNQDSFALKSCLEDIRYYSKKLKEYKETNGVNPEAIESLEKKVEELEQQKSDLLKAPDNRIKAPTRTSSTQFRLDIEHKLARVIAEQQAKTWEELEAEEQARKQARKEASKKRKQAKEQARKQETVTQPIEEPKTEKKSA